MVLVLLLPRNYVCVDLVFVAVTGWSSVVMSMQFDPVQKGSVSKTPKQECPVGIFVQFL